MSLYFLPILLGSYNRVRSIWGWLLFSCGIVHRGKGLIAIFRDFFASISENFILAGGWALGYHSMEFRHLTDISYFPKILSLKSFGNSFVYTMFISNNRPSFHLWWKENLVKDRKVSKYYETDCSFSFSLFCFAFCLSCFQFDVLSIDLQVLSSLSFRSHFILR